MRTSIHKLYKKTYKNIATDMRLIWTRIHLEFFLDEPEKFDMVVPGEKYMDEREKFVAEKCLILKGETKN